MPTGINEVYDKTAEIAWQGGIDLLSDDVRAMLIDKLLYTVDIANHEFLDDVPSGARITAGVALTTKTISGRVFNADGVTFPTVPIGPDASAIILYIHTGVDATARLVAYMESAGGLPAVLSGEDVEVSWNTGTRKIILL